MKKIFICTPYGGELFNRGYVEQACAYVARNGDMPIAPHAYFTHFLDDKVEEDRELGMKLGLTLLNECDEMWVLGPEVTDGMRTELEKVYMGGVSVGPFTVKFKKWSDLGIDHWREK